MFSMKLKELFLMLCLVKVSTLRPYKTKGLFKIGSEQRIKRGLFDKQYCFVVKITNRYVVNIDTMSDADFIALGYSNKKEYMMQDYNVRNTSNLRIKYEFEVIEVNEKRLKELEVI